MATRASRKARARATEKAVADYLQYVFPEAAAVPSALSGSDILKTPGIAVEVKARRDLDLQAWLRQATKAASPEDLPVVVHRPDGLGVESVDMWPCTMRFYDFLLLLRKAGYGPE